MSNLVLIRVVRSDNKQFILGTETWQILSKGLKGIDYPSISIYSDKNGVGDGALLSGKRVNDRDIQVECRHRHPEYNRSAREAAISFFNPGYSYRLYVTYHGATKWIDAEIEGFSLPSENIHRYMTMTIKFYCPDGYFRSVDDFGQNIASLSAMFGFPYIQTLPGNPKITIVSDSFNFGQNVTIENDGDTMAYPRVTIKCSGHVVNPRVFKNEYYVRVLDEFDAGDTIEIDFENCTIRKNGANWIHYVDRSSAFTEMGLSIGDSTFGFGADDGDMNMAVYLYYNKLYLGL